MDEKNKIYLYRVLCILTLAAVLLPASCNYIMSGGIIEEWITRIEEIAMRMQNGYLYLYPSAETLAVSSDWGNAINSNLWFFLPGFLYRISWNIVLAYRLFMLALQIGTLLFSILLFQSLFEGEESKLPVFYGILLYMTCPYRIYVCYDLADLSQAAVWMLLPLYAWAAVGILKDRNKLRSMALAALALAGIGYANVLFSLIVMVITLMAGLLTRSSRMLLSSVGATLIFLPGLYRLIQYLFLGYFQEWDPPVQSIMANGYRFGEYFSSYTWREGRPGMGMGMLLCLLAGLWLGFVKREREENKVFSFFRGISALLIAMSFCRFPWDMVQRLGSGALKLISLIGTPALFGGMAYGGLCVVSASAINRVSKQENRKIAFAVPVMVLLACLGLCIYQCNMLTYNRYPFIYQ